MPQYTQNANDKFLKEHITSGWPWRMLIFTSSVFLIVIVVYLAMLFGYNPHLVNSVSEIESELSSLSSQVETETQQNFIEFYSQIVNLKSLLNSHIKTSQFMPLIESVTHKNVSYSSVVLVVPEKSLSIEGFAENYDVLASQLALYEKSNWIEKVILDNSSQAERVIKFSARIKIKDEAFNL